MVCLIIPILAALFNAVLILFPKELIEAAKNGLLLWFNTVLPSLLPFIVCANILLLSGFTQRVGKYLTPITRLFGVSGEGGFAILGGMLSGYPMGAKLTASLYESNAIDETEAQRLLSFANNPGPLFVIGAVGVGMYKNAAIGYFLLCVIYIAAIVTGLLFRSYGQKQPAHGYARVPAETIKRPAYISPGVYIGKAVADAMQTVLFIGGFIIFFSVVAAFVKRVGLLNILPGEITRAVAIGFLEITNGTSAVNIVSGTMRIKLVATVAVLSFGGLCIHVQSIGFLEKTPVSFGVYLVSKLVNTAIAVIICYFALSLPTIMSLLMA